MSRTSANRTLTWDWYDGHVPENVTLEEGAYLETTYSFLHYQSQLAAGVRIGHAATVYLGTMFDVGPKGRVSLGQYSLVHGAWFICDAQVEIGDYSLISWNVVLMDTYRVPLDPSARRRELMQVPTRPLRRPAAQTPAQPIHIGRNVWLGFDVCVLPGVTIGDGAIVGARSVVAENVAPYTVVAGNPARLVRSIENDEFPPAT
jgi:transferase family hexapeptide repeat protein